MAEYVAGSVKRNTALNEVAVRTIFPEDEPSMAGQAWLVATPSKGAYFLKTSDIEVDGWVDVP